MVPFLSSILVTIIGLTYIPLLAKAPYAPTISYTLKSGVPNAIAGTLGMFELTPKFLAKLATGLGPTLSIS